ncbi:hypothetical protein HanRHA438_Chr09g0397411 [Helianthus annuus]|nr:hypothetical protein HanHA89_Chr09g0337681 [Helianthus annuus]KAJ0888022.1 hypothetical protein HanRHA438_Chr09g0397411 [Helianthus annuus]
MHQVLTNRDQTQQGRHNTTNYNIYKGKLHHSSHKILLCFDLLPNQRKPSDFISPMISSLLPEPLENIFLFLALQIHQHPIMINPFTTTLSSFLRLQTKWKSATSLKASANIKGRRTQEQKNCQTFSATTHPVKM